MQIARAEDNWTTLLLYCRHFQGNQWLHLHGKRASLRYPARNQAKLVHLYPHNTTIVHKLCDTNYAAKLNFMNWCRHWVNAEVIHPTLVCFISEASVFQQTRELSE
jgi:hypothetical protein